MSRTRLAAVAATLSCALLLGAASTASAQAPTQDFAKRVPVTGTAKNGKKFTGTYAIDRFTRKGGKQYAVGTLRGRLSGRRVRREDVRIPVALARPAQGAQIPPTPGACQILNLTLQPIDLNLLGLRVRTSRIDLRIEGVRGPGNLLGNLLCAITGILDPQAATRPTASQLTQVLNALLALVPRTA
jgi:hypothetical protein